MLIQFTFDNYKSFCHETTLSTVASNKTDHSEGALIRLDDVNLLTTVAIFGANASGKTNLFRAFIFMRNMVYELANENKSNWKETYTPFALKENQDPNDVSSSFEVVFTIGQELYRYGYEISAERVLSEWLYLNQDSDEIQVISRDGEKLDYNKRFISPKIADNLKSAKMLRTDTLFLSILSIWNDPLSQKIVNWFASCNILSASSDRLSNYSIRKLRTPMKLQMIRFMQSADFNIEDMRPRETKISELPEEMQNLIPLIERSQIINGINIAHKRYDENGLSHSSVLFSLEREESLGTQRMFALSAPIIDTLQKGKVLFIDEVDNGLHTDLLRAIVSLFLSPQTNKHHAQLIINTHDVSLLDDDNLFQPDQIYITEKDRFGVSHLTSLLQFTFNSDKSLGELYREGRFGGVPYLFDFMKDVLQ